MLFAIKTLYLQKNKEMDYKETCDYLFSSMPTFQEVGSAAYKPGLERIESFCEYIGSPHSRYMTIHIAGTNGKGSTSHMLAAVLQSAGYSVGLFTSPHLRDFRERIRVDGEMIAEREVIEFVESHRSIMESLKLSFFEMSAAMAFDHFAQQNVDIAVVECGLGGRLDATNIVDPILSIITNISIDHTQYLGDTLPAIAAEKAGIIKEGRGVILGEGSDEYLDVIKRKAAEMCSELIVASDHYSVLSSDMRTGGQSIKLQNLNEDENLTLALDLMGEYQHKNIVTLLCAIDYLNQSHHSIEVSEGELREGLRSVVRLTSLRGRWEQLSSAPRTICDTGHNKAGLQEIVKQLKHTIVEHHEAHLICVLGFSNDKDISSILPLFATLPNDTHFIFTRAGVARSLPIETICAEASRLEMSFASAATVREAISMAKQQAGASDVIFIGGSTFIVAEI